MTDLELFKKYCQPYIHEEGIWKDVSRQHIGR